jgi:antirestriction protein
MTELRIYAACLASYNNGILHGAWIDCDGKDGDDLRAEVNAMLAASRIPDAEEWAIHDTEGFGRLVGEYSTLDTVATIAEALEDDADGRRMIALRYLIENNGETLSDALDKLDDVFVSEQEPKDWAYDRFDETHEGGVDALPATIRYHIDWEEVAREAEMNGEICRFDGYLIEDRT